MGSGSRAGVDPTGAAGGGTCSGADWGRGGTAAGVGAGACVTARVSIDRRQLLVVNDRGERVEDGEIALWAGTGQSDSLTASLTGHDAVRVQ